MKFDELGWMRMKEDERGSRRIKEDMKEDARGQKRLKEAERRWTRLKNNEHLKKKENRSKVKKKPINNLTDKRPLNLLTCLYSSTNTNFDGFSWLALGWLGLASNERDGVGLVKAWKSIKEDERGKEKMTEDEKEVENDIGWLNKE